MSVSSENNTETNVENCNVFIKQEEDYNNTNISFINTTSGQNSSRLIKQEFDEKIPLNVYDVNNIKQVPDDQETVTVKIEENPQDDSSLLWVVKEEHLDLGPYEITSNVIAPPIDHVRLEDVSSQENKCTTKQNIKERHLTKHTVHKPDSCEETAQKHGILKSLLKSYTDSIPYTCGVCKRKFREKCNLQRHLTTHTLDIPNTCKYIGTSKEHSILNIRLLPNTRFIPIKCNVCQEKFSDNRRLKRHMIKHTGVKPYSCHICQRQYSVKSSLQVHLKKHMDDMQYSCDICKRLFKEKGNLKKHMGTHTGVKPYLCDICPSRFIQKGHLKTHLKLHKRDI